MSRDLRRRELIEPLFVPYSLEFPFFHHASEDKAHNTVKQCSNDSRLGNNGSASERPNGMFTKHGIMFLERAVGSFGCRAQCKQLPIRFRAAQDLQVKTRLLSSRNVSRKSKTVCAMGTISIKLKIGCSIGFDTLLETGERKTLSCGVKAVRTSRKMTIGGIEPATAIIAPFKKSFTDQLLISGIVID
jgi:hypothetical protein